MCILYDVCVGTYISWHVWRSKQLCGAGSFLLPLHGFELRSSGLCSKCLYSLSHVASPHIAYKCIFFNKHATICPACALIRAPSVASTWAAMVSEPAFFKDLDTQISFSTLRLSHQNTRYSVLQSECSYPPEICVPKLGPQSDVIMRCGLWEIIKSQGQSPLGVFMSVILSSGKRPRELCYPLETWQEDCSESRSGHLWTSADT